jgi:PPOX class probable F420-dependent enzyme
MGGPGGALSQSMAYHRMSPDEIKAFLAIPRAAVVATVRPDGRPHAAPVWFAVDGEDLVFTTGADTVKGRNLAANPRATLVVQDDRAPFSFVSVEGTVVLDDDLKHVGHWTARIGGRYMGSEQAEQYGERNGVPGELLVRLTPSKIVSAGDVAS